MDFDLSPEQNALRQDVRRLASEVIAPTAEERSRTSTWDHGLWREIGRHRWPGVVIPTAYGGMGLTAVEHAIIVSEVSRVDASLGAALNLIQQTIMAILSFAPDRLKELYLPLLASGESFAVTGITEEDAGSKLSDMSTRAERTDGGWIVNGTKTEVHVPEHSRTGIVFAKTDAGVSAFLVDNTLPGFQIKETREIVGLRGLPMTAIGFADCKLEEDRLLGEEGGAYDVFFKSFDLTRIGNAAKCFGIAEGALEAAVDYAGKRRIGQNVVTDFQGLRWQLSDLDARIEGARLLTFKAAREYVQTGRSTLNSARAKLLASTTAMEATTVALQMTGSHGCFSSSPFARFMMDAKVSQITGGTIEILRNTIARHRYGKPTAPTS